MSKTFRKEERYKHRKNNKNFRKLRQGKRRVIDDDRQQSRQIENYKFNYL